MILLSLLSLAFLFLVFISITFVRNIVYIKPIHDVLEHDSERVNPFQSEAPLVSICIPARNEELSINTCVRSALHQTYPNIEVLVLDDESTDKTPEILHEIKRNIGTNLTILSGHLKPVGWLGKNWACHQLSKKASGEIILFIDADTHLEPHTIEAVVEQFKANHNTGLISIWPEQELVTISEHLIIPLVYYSLFSFLYLRYTEKSPRWLPESIKSVFASKFAAANGQFMAFKRTSYDVIGGHENVKNQVVEDVQLAKACISNGIPVQNFSGQDAVYCRMYHTYSQIQAGFRKNFFAGFDYSYFTFMFSGFLHFISFILPLGMLVFYVKHEFWYGALLCYVLLLIPIFQRYWLHSHFNWKLRFVPLHILGVIWFQYLGVLVLFDRLFKRSVSWKGRDV
ncbi:glycosyltransferase [bacterium]|nr:MAG: glycosyltransferase [bacterium]